MEQCQPKFLPWLYISQTMLTPDNHYRLFSQRYKSMKHTLRQDPRKVYHGYGLVGLYRGCATTLLWTIPVYNFHKLRVDPQVPSQPIPS